MNDRLHLDTFQPLATAEHPARAHLCALVLRSLCEYRHKLYLAKKYFVGYILVADIWDIISTTFDHYD